MDYIKRLLNERTSIDGFALIAICGSVILFGTLAKLVAWIGLAYGIYTLVTEEQR